MATAPTPLRDIAKVVRSKNAGPFEITLDVVFKTREDFEAVKKSGVITKELVSELYNVPTQAIITFGFFDLVNAVKITLPRLRPQGGIGETDMHAAQQHVPLQEIPRAVASAVTSAVICRRVLLASASALGLAGRASAQAWPSRPLKLVAPFAPGGGSDFTSRLVAEKMSARLGQTMLVDNKPGAGGNLGAEIAIKSPPDGYTYLTISGSYAVNSILHKPSFDSLNDIVAIGQFTDEPTVLCVHPGVPARTLKELVALCRRDPGKVAYGSSGPGGLVHLATEFFLDAAGTKATHVPYRGTALALNDLIAGNLQMLSGGTTTMLPYIKNGQVRPLAITKKIAAADIATYGEQGYPTLDFNLWHGMIGPKGIPAEIVQRMNAELDAVLKSPAISERPAGDGVIAVGGSSEAFMVNIRAEVKRWQDFIQRTGIKLD